MAAIVVAGTAQLATANTGRLSVPLPDGAAAGDLLLLADGLNDSIVPTFTEPTSPTIVQAGTFGASGAAADVYGGVHRALLSAPDIGNGDIAFNTTANSAIARLVVGAVLYRGHDPITPIAGSVTSTETVTTDTHTTPDLVLPAGTYDGRTVRLVHAVIEKSSAADTWVLPAGVSRRAAAYSLNAGGCSVIVADTTDVLIPAGATAAQRTFAGKAFRTTKSGAAVTTGKARMVQLALLAASDQGGISPNTAAAYAGTRIELIAVGHLDPSFTYLWEQTEGDPATIVNPTSASAYYLRPYRLRRRQVFRLTITGNGNSRSTTVTVRGNREIEALVEDSNGVYS